ncbi:MAG: hypothetical protein M3419_08205 [Actinomycetota bacterium]|nr:hypothetical protein [Actinomycetota bacterium]
MRTSTGLALATLTASVLVVSTPNGEQPAHSNATPGSAPGRGSAPVPAAVQVPALRLALDGGAKTAGDPLHRLRSSGWAPVRAEVVSRDGGAAVRVLDRRGGWAARLPAHSGQSDPPRASIRVRREGPNDPFSPGETDFSFGVDFHLNSVSSGSTLDDGDNLVQRGLYAEAAQYKVQVDGGVPRCRISGHGGAVVVRARSVQRQQWYRILCSRSGQAVTIRVWKLTSSGPVCFDSATGRGPIGSVTFPRTVPLSVGGKLDAAGAVASGSSDQFNGVIDEIVYDVSR